MCGHKLLQLLRSSSVIVLFALPSLATSESSARQQFDKITAMTSLDREGIQHWHMKLSFDLYDLDGKPQESGTAEEWWAGPDRARLVISSASFHQALPEGELAVSGREPYLIHLLLDAIVHPVFKEPAKADLASTTRPRTFGQITVSCTVVSQFRNEKTPPEYCTDTSGDLRLVMLDGGRSQALNDIQSLIDSRVATTETIAYLGRVAIRGHIESIEPFDPDHSTLQLGRIAPVLDSTIIPPHILDHVTPIYPAAARQMQQGMVVLHTRILTNGKPGPIDVIASTDPTFTQAALDAVNRWNYTPMKRYKVPAECDSVISILFIPESKASGAPLVWMAEQDNP